MHCLGAVAGSAPSPNAGAGSRGGILSVFRALGVLVCEGRIQGPPRGYKEGPHCTPPMQPFPNNHVCEEDGYLCDRYVVLIREIADRTAFGSYLCVEILLCSDCPCGLGKATSKNPICPVPSLSISPWQQTSELLLEYWCISVVPSKGPETMNFQGLYQAVRSRLHFSQVAAWWSRSSGSEPRYIATRVVPYNEDNLRKFRETPTEHTFPLAGSGDGSSIKVTVWALPRMEEVPVLNCPLHPNIEKDEEGVARALTPTKAMPVVAVTSAQNSESLVMPVLVDDRLQTPCNKPGKHHCHCEEEDVASPPSPSIPRPNGERKRRRSLPCGPAEVNGCSTATQSVPLPALRESTASQRNDCSSGSSSYPRSSSETLNNRVFPHVKLIQQTYQQQQQQPQHQNHQQFEENTLKSRNNLNSDNLERCFRTQLSIEERDGNVEKRYKRTFENSDADEAKSSDKAELKVQNNSDKSRFASTFRKNFNSDNKTTGKNGLFENLIPFNASLPWSFVESWNNSAANGKCGFQSLRASNNARLNGSSRVYLANSTPVIDPFKQSSPFHESNPGPSTYNSQFRYKLLHPFDPACMVHQTCTKSSTNSLGPYADSGKAKQETTSSKNDESSKVRGKSNRDLHQMMLKLSFPEEKEKEKEEGGIFDWFSKVPGRVLGVAPNNSYAESSKSTNLKSQDQRGNEVKFKNCNLELSQREFDEVLAVLRARTPSGRRRAPLKTIKRRERYEKSQEDGQISDKGVMKFATNLDQVKGTCESCNHKYCKKKDHELAKKTTVDFNQTSYDNKNIYDPTYERQDKLASYAMNEDARGDKSSLIDGKQTANTADCLQTVSNKAEVLLGAILRTSKERKGLSDISNGTRSLTIASNSENENDLQVEQIQGTENVDREPSSKIVPFDDGDKSLPLVLNKKFNKFRQLFKKEKELFKQDKKKEEDSTQHSSTPCNNSNNNNYNNNVQNNWSLDSRRDLTRESKAKRKIDFSNFSEDAVALGKVEDLDCSTNGAHQNSRIYSTNYKEGEDHRAARLLLHSTNQKVDDESDRELDDQRERNDEKARKDIDLSSSLIAKSTLQNAFLSSKVRNNNHKVVGVEEDEALDKAVPSAIEQERFRRSLENAASMVFHSRTGLPLTSSPAPLRRGSCCFDYDSSLNSVSSKRSALFELNTPPSPGAVSLEETDKETENACEGEETPRRRSTSRHRPQSHALLGSFEESALNGRLEPVSTVHGFTAELGASGSFCPKHRKLPVTVFFYTLGDNDKVSTPYLAHINLGKKGYQVPRSGTIQVTLLNPLGTVVKMFVVLYDLSDMPPRSHTFLRQRTLRDKTLRYLVHLRFMSGKTGRIYLHTDIRMIICRKADVDTASDFGSEPPKELRSYIHGPTNPKFSPRC